MGRRVGNGAFAASTDVPPGAVVINKFGRNNDIDTTTDPEDVWSGGGLYPFPSTAQSLAVVSDIAGDAAAGIGAQTVTVQGLDANFAQQEETVTLNGIAEVNLPGTWMRVNRAFVVTAGSDGNNVGTLNIQAQGGGTIYGVIEPDEGQTTQALYTTPAGSIGRLVRHWATFDRPQSGTATLHVMIRLFGEAWRNRQAFTVSDGFTWDFGYSPRSGIYLPEKTDVRMEAHRVSVNDIAIDAGFDLWCKA